MAAGGVSFLTAVLQKSGRLEKDDLQTCVGKLSQKAMEVKAEVYKSIYKQYTDFIHSYNLTMELNTKVKELSSEMNLLNGKIKGDVETQLKKANSIYTDLSQQLTETNSIINVLQKLCEIHDSISRLSRLRDCEEYYEVAQVLNIVKKHLGDLPKSGDESKIFKALKVEYSKEHSDLVYTLECVWDKCVSWRLETCTPSWDNIDGHLKTKLTINTSNTAQFEMALQTMKSMKMLDKKLKVFGKTFLQFLIRPIIHFARLKPVQSETKESCMLSFIKDSSNAENIETTSVFERMSKVFEFLSSTLANKNISRPAKKGEEEQDATLASMLGELIWPSLRDIIIKDVLTKSAPTTSGQLEKYESTVAATVKFENTLVTTGYLKDGTNALQLYAKNITQHFANKKCQDLLFTAREILKCNANFHNTVLVSLPERKNKVKGVNGEKITEEKPKVHDTDHDNKLSDSMFHFPLCRVSECIPKFMSLAYGTLLEATETTKSGDVQLFYTARNMFELYRMVVPVYYEDDLRDLPQMSALHYNNCMFISHRLLTLGHQVRPKLSQPLNGGAATFVDLVSPIRQLGEKCFKDQLEKQCRSLFDIVEEGGRFDDLDTMLMEKAFQQVCYQLFKLNKVWTDILPLNIYHSALGVLFNVVLKKIIDELLKIEDISSDEARSFHHLMGIFVKKCPDIVQISSEEIGKVVIIWKKFIELRCVIDSSLQGIEDRWAEGKGPLSQQFTCNEVRGLVRALFQNTDRRANLLTKIRPTATTH